MNELFVPFQHRTFKTKVKDSRFIADIFPVSSEEEIAHRLAEVRERERGATHICFAWRLGAPPKMKLRSSDAGEPAGSAGKPILQAIESAAMTNILVTVTRYFGGTKLGIGGLIRAYGGAARDALANISREPFVERSVLVLQVPYPMVELVHRLTTKFRGQVQNQKLDSEATLDVLLPTDKIEAFKAELQSRSHGRAIIKPIG